MPQKPLLQVPLTALTTTRPSTIPTAGAGLFSTQPLKPGEDLFIDHNPLIAIPSDDHISNTCAWCLIPEAALREGQLGLGLGSGDKDKEVLMRCGGCRVVKYCCQSHQKLDWSTGGHKLECAAVFAKLSPRVLPASARVTLRLLLLKPKLEAAGKWDDVIRLESHIDNFQRAGGERWSGILLTSKAVYEYSKPALAAVKGGAVTELQVRELYTRVLTNTITVTSLVEPGPDGVGLCFHPLVAGANHSCRPNLEVVFDGRSLCARAVREVRMGEELTVGYIDLELGGEERRRGLRERWWFECRCERCVEEMGVEGNGKVVEVRGEEEGGKEEGKEKVGKEEDLGALVD